MWGLPLLIVTLVFMCYLLFGHLLPTSIGHFQFSGQQIVETLWFGYAGIFSTIMGIVLNLVFVLRDLWRAAGGNWSWGFSFENRACRHRQDPGADQRMAPLSQAAFSV